MRNNSTSNKYSKKVSVKSLILINDDFNDFDFVIECLKSYETELLIIKNCFMGMIQKISDKELKPRILKDYLESFRNNSDYFYEIFNKAPDFYDHWDDEDGRMIVTPNITNKDKISFRM